MATGNNGSTDSICSSPGEEQGSSNGRTNRNSDEHLSLPEEQAKVVELRNALGQLSGRSLKFCSDDCLKRYLRARNWSLKKAHKMLKESIKWREAYKPEDIRWEQVEVETRTGKVYRADFYDKYGRTVLIMRPARQNTKSQDGQIRQLVYSLENAIVNLPLGQEQIVWLIDFTGWTLSNCVPLTTARETASVLQNHYPERLAIAILYNPPRVFEAFWGVVKMFLDPKTFQKVKFVYSKKPETFKIMEDLFDMEDLDLSFGGKKDVDYNHEEYGKRMRDDDIKTEAHWQLSCCSLQEAINGGVAADNTKNT